MNALHPSDEPQPGPGIVEQLARDDVERKKFLRMAGRRVGTGVAASGLAAFIAACGSSSSSSSRSTSAAAAGGSSSMSSSAASADPAGTGDLAIVNYALTLEYLEAQFYAKVGRSGLFSGKTLSVLKTFGMEEAEHVLALKKVAGSLGTPAKRPVGRFPIKSASQVAKLAGTVENLGAAAYLGQAGNIQSREILAAALAIHSVEARHAATLNTLLKLSPTPEGAFAKPMTMAQVLTVVKPFIA
ncbi:MAG TPA: ferritin-like domain-containing protein [Solirubrobacteraceae bacterium]